MITRYTTKQVAKKLKIGHQTLLRWLYAKKVAEPERLRLGGSVLRLWRESDINKVREYKEKGLAARRSRKRTGRKKGKPVSR